MPQMNELRWQNKSIPASSDLRGVLAMGLLAAWFYFVWQLVSLPPFAASLARLPPLLRFALEKGQYMPDFGMIIAGMMAFHCNRQLWRVWDGRIAIRVYLAVVVPLLAYLGLAVLLLEAVHFASPAHSLVLPWQDRLMGVQFRVVGTAAVCAAVLPLFLYWLWTAVPDFCWACIALCFGYYGLTFHIHTHRLIWMWPPTALVDFILGGTLCASLFRAVEYLSAVRGPTIILGWLALLAGSILNGPSIFFLGFIMVVAGTAISERTAFLPGEGLLLLWSRTALAIILVQPAVLTAWLLWGSHMPYSGLSLVLGLAAATQILALLLTVIVDQPARRLTPAQPA
jgi:hypothetical protein